MHCGWLACRNARQSGVKSAMFRIVSLLLWLLSTLIAPDLWCVDNCMVMLSPVSFLVLFGKR
jgi:hypothetical protein